MGGQHWDLDLKADQGLKATADEEQNWSRGTLLLLCRTKTPHPRGFSSWNRWWDGKQREPDISFPVLLWRPPIEHHGNSRGLHSLHTSWPQRLSKSTWTPPHGTTPPSWTSLRTLSRPGRPGSQPRRPTHEHPSQKQSLNILLSSR